MKTKAQKQEVLLRSKKKWDAPVFTYKLRLYLTIIIDFVTIINDSTEIQYDFDSSVI